MLCCPRLAAAPPSALFVLHTNYFGCPKCESRVTLPACTTPLAACVATPGCYLHTSRSQTQHFLRSARSLSQRSMHRRRWLYSTAALPNFFYFYIQHVTALYTARSVSDWHRAISLASGRAGPRIPPGLATVARRCSYVRRVCLGRAAMLGRVKERANDLVKRPARGDLDIRLPRPCHAEVMTHDSILCQLLKRQLCELCC